MKRVRLALLLGIAVILIASRDGSAQNKSSELAGGQSEQVMKALLSEVHQLRVALQQISVNTYRGRLMVERLRLQQDQVSRIANELKSTRDEIVELKSQQVTVKERLEHVEKQQDKGVVSPEQVNEVRALMAGMMRREQTLTERETQLSGELEQERAALADLNKRLDALERDIVLTGLVDDGKRNPK